MCRVSLLCPLLIAVSWAAFGGCSNGDPTAREKQLFQKQDQLGRELIDLRTKVDIATAEESKFKMNFHKVNAPTPTDEEQAVMEKLAAAARRAEGRAAKKEREFNSATNAYRAHRGWPRLGEIRE
jgi:hypothetical protein